MRNSIFKFYDNTNLKNWFGTIPATKNSNKGYEFRSPFPKYISPTDDSISLVAMHPFNSIIVPNSEILNGISECGFNAVCIEFDNKTIEEIGNKISESSLKLIVNCQKYVFEENHTLSDLLQKTLTNIENIKGLYLFHQPKYIQLENQSSLSDEWNTNRPSYPNLTFIIDLECDSLISWEELDSDDSEHEIERKTIEFKKFMNQLKLYSSYLNLFQENFLPALWSYDYNPFKIEDDTIFIDHDSYYFYLESYTLRSKLFNRPFWVTCHCIATDNEDINLPVVTEEFMRFEAFSALAYGAKGLKFGLSPDSLNYRNISNSGDSQEAHTQIWNYLQNVIKEIKGLNNIFFNATLIECLHTIHHYTGTSIYEPNYSFGPAVKIESYGDGFQISHLFSGEIDYLVIINHDIHNSQSIKLYFADYWTVRWLKIYSNGNFQRLPVIKCQNAGILYDVPAGGYLIFDWK